MAAFGVAEVVVVLAGTEVVVEVVGLDVLVVGRTVVEVELLSLVFWEGDVPLEK